MDKILRPERLDANPNSSGASKEWLHWKRTFQNFLSVLNRDADKFGVLTNYLSPRVYQYVEDCATYEAATETLQALYVKPTNEVYARHLLATRRQQPAETLDEFLQALKTLSKDCNYKSVTSVVYREESIRDALTKHWTSQQCSTKLAHWSLLPAALSLTLYHHPPLVRQHLKLMKCLTPLLTWLLSRLLLDRNVFSVVTAGTLAQSVLLGMQHVLNVRRKDTTRRFAVEAPLCMWQKEQRLLRGIQLRGIPPLQQSRLRHHSH